MKCPLRTGFLNRNSTAGALSVHEPAVSFPSVVTDLSEGSGPPAFSTNGGCVDPGVAKFRLAMAAACRSVVPSTNSSWCACRVARSKVAARKFRKRGGHFLPQWFAVKSKPRHELHASAELTRRGIDTFLPQILSRRRGGNGGAAEPLFPGYLFARLALGTPEWISARSAPGVAYFLGPVGAPSPVPDDLVEMIRVRIAAQSQAGWQPPFKRNERVSIEHGPLAGMSAIFEGALSPAGRVRVLLETINRLVPVDLDISLVGRAR